MPTMKYARLIVVMLGLFLVAAYGQAGKTGKKEFTFKGKVEKVDEKAKVLTVANENVPGWMNAMTMSYDVDNEDVLKKLKAGDQITAKVYEGDFKVLHNVQIAPPANTADKKDAPKK